MRNFKNNYPALQITVFILTAILVVTYICCTWKSTGEEKFGQTQLIARSFVASLPVDDLKALEAIPADISKPQYKVIKNALEELVSVNPKAKFAYILIERNSKIYFIADSEPEVSADYSPPGKEYAETDLFFKQLFKDEKANLKDYATDRWKTWTNVLIPVKDKVTGKTIAVFGMEFNAKSWFNTIFIEVTESSLSILLILVVLVLLYIIKNKNKILNDGITKLLQAEDKLQQQKEEFEMIFNLAPTQIWYKDNRNNIIRANRLACNFVGLPEDEINGHSVEEIFPSYAQKYFDDDLEVFSSGKPKLGIIGQVNNDAGELKWVHTDKFPVFGNNGNLVGLVAFTQDITYRKMTEDALRKSEAQLQTLVQTIPDLIWLKDNDGVYLHCNTMFERFFGVKEIDIIGKTDYDFLDKDLADFFRENDHKDIATGKSARNAEWITFADNGHQAFLETIKTPVYDSQNNLIGMIGVGRDITGRKKTEDALLESEIKYRTFFENSMDAILLTSPDGKTLSANQSACNMFGYSEAELIKIGRSGIEDTTDLRLSVLLMNRKLKGKAQGEVTLIRNGGTRFSAEISTSCFKNNEGLERSCMIIRDITERIKIQNEIKFQADLLNNVGQSVIATNFQKNVIYWNNAAERIYGWSSDEALGRNIVDLIPAQHSKEQSAEIIKEIRDGNTWSGEFLVRRKDGTNFLAYVTDAPILDPKGKLIGIIGISSDITERKHAEETLMKLSSVVEQAATSIIITDCNGIIEYVNHGFEDLTGFSSKEALGKTPRIIKSGTTDQQHYEGLWNTILSGKVFKAEFVNKKKNGDLYYEAKIISPIFDKNKTITHFVSTGVDISERKQAEKELIEAKNKAEESDRLKSAFLANMSHEIRTPMNGILGFAELLKEPKLSGEEQQEYISIIEQSGARMLNIINDIVSISKVESGNTKVSINETNINEQIEYIYNFFKPEAEKKGIQLHFKNSLPSKKSIIKTDSEKIYAILTNLVKNALKFTEIGTIEFGYSPVTNGESGELKFYVKDTGVGINPEHQKFIFERFRQSHESLNRNYEGAGLGLAISKAYVEMLGGKIWVESEPEKGSTFYFTVPQKY